MTDQDKTDKVIPLVDLLEEAKKRAQPEDEALASRGVFKRFALWLMNQKDQ